MHRFITKLAAGLMLVCLVPRGNAFSLLGPFADWQVPEIGYNLPGGVDLGGPMNLDEEYRFNVPMLTYGFDRNFLMFFGERGVQEVEAAIDVLNALPPFSQMSADLSEFPLITRRINHRAGALALIDLKSFTLALLLEQIGLAPAERYVWTLRSRVVINDIPRYVVVQRSFDPVTGLYSPYVNGILYTYQILQTYADPDHWEAVPIAVDPTLPSVTSVSAFNTEGGTILAAGAAVNLSDGLFYTGLTRDDVAGLRYLYRQMNINVENPPTNAVRAPQSAKEQNAIIDSSSGSPWGPPGGTPGGVLTNPIPPVLTALRPGTDKITFVRVNYDSLIGTWVAVTNRYVDRYITNFVVNTQVMDRALPAPDILFSAGDLGINAQGAPVFLTRSIAFENNAALNGTSAIDGPGIISPGSVITFSKLGQSLFHIGGGGEIDATQLSWWGSYDGTTNEPVVYPQSISIQAIEQLITSGRVTDGPSPWLPPPLLLAPDPGTGQPGDVAGGGAIGVGAGGGGGMTP